MGTRVTSIIAILVAVMAGSACSPAAPAPASPIQTPPLPTPTSTSPAPTTASGADDPAALVQRIRAEPFGDDAVAATVRILALAGIATLDDDSGQPVAPIVDPAAPMTFARHQVLQMAVEVSSSAGMPGSLVDTVAPLAGDGTEMSAVIAAYALSDMTFGSRVTRSLVVGDLAEPATTLYPTLALALVVADITGPQVPRAGTPPTARLTSTRIETAAGDPCDQVATGWTINNALIAIANANPGAEQNGRLDTILQILARSGAAYAQGGEALRREILRDLALISAMADIRSSIRHWRTTLESKPADGQHDTVQGQAPSTGQITAFVEAPLGERSGTDTACLRSLGLDEPRDDATGSEITWSLRGTPASPIVARQDETVRAETLPGARVHLAMLDYILPSESAAAHERGQLRTGKAEFFVGVDRQDKTAYRNFIGEISSRIARLQPEYAAVSRAVLDQIDAVLTVSSHVEVGVTYHEEPEETPEPTPPGPVWVHYDRPPQPGTLPLTIVELYACEGPYGRWTGDLRTGNLESDRLKVPTTELPVDFRLPGSGGKQTVSGVTADGTVDMPGEFNDIPLHYVFAVTVDGRTMSITGLPVAVAPAADLAALPIEPAPVGACTGG